MLEACAGVTISMDVCGVSSGAIGELTVPGAADISEERGFWAIGSLTWRQSRVEKH